MTPLKDTRSLLHVLKSELTFLDAGGYARWGSSPHARMSLPLVFEESPACPNFNDATRSIACRDCALMQLVPLRYQMRPVPCRHIPLNEVGETLDTLYRWGTIDDLNPIFRRWLVHTIDLLERKQAHKKWLRDQSVYDAAELT